MSTFKVEVVRLENAEKHPNADTLSIAKIFDYPVIFRTSDFNVGDLVAYIPVDSVMPDTPENVELFGSKRRIKAKKLRGIFSMGMLNPIPEGVEVKLGDDVAQILGITKYVEPEPVEGSGNMADPGWIPKFTEIENHLRYGHVYEPGEEVIITEKIHGSNGRFVHDGETLFVGSHGCIKCPKAGAGSEWWRAAKAENLEEKLSAYDNLVMYGEVHGWVQDLRYGHKQGEVSLKFFGACNAKTRQYLDWDVMESIAKELGLKTAPVLYRGPLPDLETLKALANEDSILAPGQIREGLVIVPARERQHPELGRVITKLVSERYHLRKNGTERK